MSQPPGWYPDPWQQAPERYWNGHEWTEQLRQPKTSSGYRPLIVAGVLLAALSVAVLVLADRDDGFEDATVAEQLAAVSGAGIDDDAVRPYRLALRAADPVCVEEEERIADIVLAGQQQAEGLGVDTSALELLPAIPSAVPADVRPTDCAEVVGTLVLLLAP